MALTRSNNPVACRYKMGGKDWSQSGLHPVPYDIRDFCEGIGNYSNGMMIISVPGYYQVNAMLGPSSLEMSIFESEKIQNFTHMALAGQFKAFYIFRWYNTELNGHACLQSVCVCDMSAIL